jgi:hypothetical protein
MRPKIFDLLFKDDRMFVLEVCPITTSTLASGKPPQKEWGVITRRNVPGYPPYRTDSFPSRSEAVSFYKKIVIETPRVSLGNKSPDPLPTIEEYTRWLLDEGIYDPLLNPEAPTNEGPNPT